MPFRELRPTPEAERVFDEFLLRLEERLNSDAVDRNELVRTTLYEIYFGSPGEFDRINDDALSLGAKAIGVGRYYLFPLAAAGEAGVERALGFMRTELLRDMRLMGCTNVGQLSRKNLRFRD